MSFVVYMYTCVHTYTCTNFKSYIHSTEIKYNKIVERHDKLFYKANKVSWIHLL